MKFGVRTPSVKKSLKARTTGKVKRSVKKSVNPTYGQKGMGYVNNPKKAVYNKVYNKTTIKAVDTKSIKRQEKINKLMQKAEKFKKSKYNQWRRDNPLVWIAGFLVAFLILTIITGLIIQ